MIQMKDHNLNTCKGWSFTTMYRVYKKGGKCMKRNKGILWIALIAILIGLASFSVAIYSNAVSMPSYAMIQVFDVNGFKAGMTANATIEDAIGYVEGNPCAGITDDNVYDLLEITYDKTKWNFNIENNKIGKLRLAIAKKNNWISRYGEEKHTNDIIPIPYLSYIWPPSNGFVTGTERPQVLKAGDLIDRYGRPTGAYLSPRKKDSMITYIQRALMPGTEIRSEYKVYRVKKEFIVQAGLIQPWFGVEGNGIQYYTGVIKVQDYLDNDFLEEVDPATLN